MRAKGNAARRNAPPGCYVREPWFEGLARRRTPGNDAHPGDIAAIDRHLGRLVHPARDGAAHRSTAPTGEESAAGCSDHAAAETAAGAADHDRDGCVQAIGA